MEHRQKATLLIGLGLVILGGFGLIVSAYFDRKMSDRYPAMATPTRVEVQENQQPLNQKKKNSSDQLIVNKPAEQWTKVCKNTNARYQVRYPDEWTMKIGDTIQGIQIIKNCDTPKLFKNKNDTIIFSPLDAKMAAEKISGITITAFPNSIRHSFVDPTQELIVDGEKMTWVYRDGERLLHHGTTEYSITIGDDVSEDLVSEFFSTFRFLP